MKAEYFDWLAGRDTGVSSITIMCVLNNRPSPRNGLDIPYDMDDVGRCVRMLALFPELEARLPELGDKLPMWRPYVDCWPHIKQLYNEVVAWWALSEAERKAHLRKKYSYDKASHAYEYLKRLEVASRYLSGWRPQGSLNSWKKGGMPDAN